MSKKGIVHCRICKLDIDRNIEIEDVDWVMPSKNWFYHKKCYDDWAIKKNDVHSKADEELWFSALWDYLTKDMKIGLDYTKVKSQWDNFIKKGKTPKGMYFSIRYFYEVKNGDPAKSENGIGIVPYIYQEGCKYWVDKEAKDKGICARIEEQIKKSKEREKIKIKQDKFKKIKNFDLSYISNMEDI